MKVNCTTSIREREWPPFKLIHELAEPHERRNRIYSLSLLHIERNEMDCSTSNEIVYAYSTWRSP
jgi:hypothetical protein